MHHYGVSEYQGYKIHSIEIEFAFYEKNHVHISIFSVINMSSALLNYAAYSSTCNAFVLTNKLVTSHFSVINNVTGNILIGIHRKTRAMLMCTYKQAGLLAAIKYVSPS